MKGLISGIFFTALTLAAVPAQAQYGDPTGLGKEIFNKWCLPCHAPDVNGNYPGTVALQVKYKGKIPAALEQRKDLTPELITSAVRKGITIMPIFRKTEINDRELEALIRYLTNKEHQR